MARGCFCLALVAVLQGLQPVGERIVDPRRLGPLSVLTPVDSAMLQFAVGRLTSAADVAFGLELAPEPVLEPYVARRRPSTAMSTRFAGEELKTALDAVMTKVDGYRWEERGGVVNVRPTRPSSFLDRPQSGFVFTGTALDVVPAIHLQLNPQYVRDPNPGFGLNQLLGAGHTMEQLAEIRTELLRRPIDVTLPAGASVRDILNAVVEAHGSAAWVVEYEKSGWGYEGSRISIILGHRQPLGSTWTLVFPASRGR